MECRVCKENKPLDLFARGMTNIYKCKSCVSEGHRRKVAWDICNELISYGNMSKHMFKHDGDPRSSKVVCDCGAVIRKYCRYYHNKTKKHLREMEILNSD